MIDRIRNSKINNIHNNSLNLNDKQGGSPNFKGRFSDYAIGCAVKGIRACEKNPMINVAVIDLVYGNLLQIYLQGLRHLGENLQVYWLTV